MGWKDKLAGLKNVNPKRLGKETWRREKLKSAGFLKIAEKMGGKHILHQTMKRQWYRHIDKALEEKATARDAKHWKKMHKTLKKETMKPWPPSIKKLIGWVEEFGHSLRNNKEPDSVDKEMLKFFRAYMEDCEKHGFDLYIAKNELVEGFK